MNIKKLLRHILNFMIGIEYSVIILLICLTLVPRIFGIEPRIVQSGSMVPAYNVNDIVYINHHYTFNQMKIGDVVAFTVHDQTMVMHRVTDINEENFITKGDANQKKDAPISKNNLIGEVIWDVPFIGYFINCFKNIGFLLITCLIILIQNIAKNLLKEELDSEK